MLVTKAFSEMVREESLADHRHAEESEFIVDLMAGRITRAGYARYLAQFFAIYRTLDRLTERLQTNLDLHGFYDPRLARSDSIRADLRSLGDPVLSVTEATEAYTARLREVSDSPDLRLLAHHYTRYLGDLSGGRIIAAHLGRHLGLTADNGLAFYQFPGIPKPPVYKQAYRARLDALTLSLDQQSVFIDEVRVAYRCNRLVFDSLSSAA